MTSISISVPKECWHGTTASALAKIRKSGFSTSDGFFGSGVYLTSNRAKAVAWALFRAQDSPFYSKQSRSDQSKIPLLDEPVVIRVNVDPGKVQVFDMTHVQDADYFYYWYHHGECTSGGVPRGKSPNWCYCGRCQKRYAKPWEGRGLRDANLCATSCRGVKGAHSLSNDDQPIEGQKFLKDELGRLMFFEDGFWALVRENGTQDWRARGFDSLYVPETLPQGRKALSLWPGAELRMTGDELIVDPGLRVTYVSHEAVSWDTLTSNLQGNTGKGVSLKSDKGSHGHLSSSKPLSQWEAQDVSSWVRSLGEQIAKLAPNFEKAGVTGALLATFDKDDLKELGFEFRANGEPGLATKSFQTHLTALIARHSNEEKAFHIGGMRSKTKRDLVKFLEEDLCGAFHSDASISSLRTLAKQAAPKLQKLLQLDLDETVTTCQFLKNLVVDTDRSTPQTPRRKTTADLIAIGIVAQPIFDSILRDLLKRPNKAQLPLNRLLLGPVKTKERLQAKMDDLKVSSRDPMCVFDINRATIVCSTQEEFVHITTNIGQHFYHMLKVKNKFKVAWEVVEEPPCIFYQLALPPRDELKGLLDKGTSWVVEVQVTTPEIIQTKELCHMVYDLTRATARPKYCPVCHRDVCGNGS